MPDRNIQFVVYGAHGMKGHGAVARQLDALAGFIATPTTARLHCLTRLTVLARLHEPSA